MTEETRLHCSQAKGLDPLKSDVYQTSPLRTLPYSSLIVEADSAKQQVTLVFQTEVDGQISNRSRTA